MTHYTLACHENAKKDAKPGDTIDVMLEGEIYVTFIDENGTQRFRRNTVLEYMFDHNTDGRKIDHTSRDGGMHTQMLNLNTLAIAFKQGKFDKRDYCEIVMPGYSVCGFCSISSFSDWTIQNPYWGNSSPVRISRAI